MKYYPHPIIRTLLCLALIAAPQHAFALKPVATFTNWSLFSAKQDGKPICYIASLPKNKRGSYSKRDEPYLLVSYKSRALDEISVSVGYEFAPDSEASLSINGHTYTFFTKGEIAWAYDAALDMKLIDEMKSGSELQVTGTSKKASYSVDTYSLNGFAAAYKRMKAQCK